MSQTKNPAGKRSFEDSHELNTENKCNVREQQGPVTMSGMPAQSLLQLVKDYPFAVFWSVLLSCTTFL